MDSSIRIKLVHNRRNSEDKSTTLATIRCK